MEGRCATEVDPSSVAAQEIKSLVKEITALFADPDSEEEMEEEVSGNKKSAKKSAKEMADA